MAESIDIRELNERIERQSAFVTNLTTLKPVRNTEYKCTISLYFTDNAASINPTPIENIIMIAIGITERNMV